ncbi:MAG: NADH-quinone oxidoreductase subunit NuoK [Anaerolineales bacterium]|nr:NADH-quinone oxidoreductase subunit NuoK [Anaerolineales bacterium]
MPLSWYLVFAAALFAVGLYGAIARRNAIAALMGIELMLNAATVNLLACWRYSAPGQMNGQVFAAVLLAVAAAETAVGLALILSVYRLRKTVLPEETDLMKG